MRRAGCIIQSRGDWMEHAERFGFFGHASSLRPCFCCATSPEDMFRIVGVSPLGLPWHVNTQDDWEAACERCTIRVTFPQQRYIEAVSAFLVYDIRKTGSLGRAVTQSFPALGLVVGDRLEPAENLPDVGAFELLVAPVTVKFWRPSLESMVRHRCPSLKIIVASFASWRLTCSTYFSRCPSGVGRFCHLVLLAC